MAHANATAIATPGRLVLPALCLGPFIAMLNSAAPAPFLPAMSDDLGVSVALLGQVTTATLFLSAALALVVGPLADRIGSRRFIIAGLIAAAVSLFVYGVTPVFSVLFFAAIAGAIAGATVPGLSLAIAGSRFSGPAARRAIGWIVASISGAAIVGVPIMTSVGDLTGWRVAFLTASVAAVVAAVLVAAWLPGDPRPADGSPAVGGILDAYRPLLGDGGMRRLYACTLTRSLCWMGLLTYYGALLKDSFGLDTGEIGLVYMLGGSGYYAGSLVAGGPLAHLPARPMVAVSNTIMALVSVVIFTALLSTPLTVALLPLTAFAGAVGWVGLTSTLAGETPAGKGTTMMLNSSLFNLGAAAGAGIGGFLLATGGFEAVAVGLPLSGVVSALLVWTPRRAPALA